MIGHESKAEPPGCLHRLIFATRNEELALADFLNWLECAKKMAEEVENAKEKP